MNDVPKLNVVERKRDGRTLWKAREKRINETFTRIGA